MLVCARAAVRDLYPAHEGPHVMARGLTGLGVVALVAPLAGAAAVQHGGRRHEFFPAGGEIVEDGNVGPELEQFFSHA